MLGAGNLGTHLSFALQNAGHQVMQIYSKTESSASELGERAGVQWTTDISSLIKDADLYIYALKDSVLSSVMREVSVSDEAIHVHTGGSVDMHIFKGVKKQYGVFYPLQTFTKVRELDFRKIPLFTEGSDARVLELLQDLAESMSDMTYTINSEQRLRLHISAVFACNFVNHMYNIASDVVQEANLPFEVLLPLIQETAAKVVDLHPVDAQTGPAKRYDTNIIHKHLDLLRFNSEWGLLYQQLSQMIFQKHLHQS